MLNESKTVHIRGFISFSCPIILSWFMYLNFSEELRLLKILYKVHNEDSKKSPFKYPFEFLPLKFCLKETFDLISIFQIDYII